MTKDTLLRPERIDHLIQTKATGNPKKLASRIAMIKDSGTIIKQNNGQHCCCHEKKHLSISFISDLSRNRQTLQF